MGNTRQSAEYIHKQALKRHWIPLCCAGKCTEREAAVKIGVTPTAVSQIKRRYRLKGPAAFINAHTGATYQHYKFSPAVRRWICDLYREQWQGLNFSAYRDVLQDEHGLSISGRTLSKILAGEGIRSPKWRGPRGEKVQHKPRKERPCEGELVQLDASSYDWAMTGKTWSLHGAIDDATHKVLGLYMTENECRLGYSEVMRQILANGAPSAVYIDRHASLVKNTRKKGRTLEERLDWSREETTHWTEVCEKLNTEIILALSPQAKGRIERLWQTMQGRLPFLLRHAGVTTMEQANDFLRTYIGRFNARFAVKPQSGTPAWRVPEMTPKEIDFLLQVRTKKTTRANGCFVFHGFTFRLCAPRAACRAFTLCMSERDGVRAYMDGTYYHVSLLDPLTDCVGDTMPQVEKNLVARYCLGDQHTNVYTFSAGSTRL